MMTVRCPTCRGKGHVLDKAALLAGFLMLLIPFERNRPDGVTRERCPQCKGRGWVRR